MPAGDLEALQIAGDSTVVVASVTTASVAVPTTDDGDLPMFVLVTHTNLNSSAEPVVVRPGPSTVVVDVGIAIPLEGWPVVVFVGKNTHIAYRKLTAFPGTSSVVFTPLGNQ